ncbi:peptidoglycan bridge formation glycyltransferase FemA/FemB family protein [Enterococcus rotai]|uniref:peptidoglycan bridge formation glycyltransferase FemA/FemB family protein n=1 Tax=Enterococcus rotai TaxID=118060 RepID=UPI0032B3F095
MKIEKKALNNNLEIALKGRRIQTSTAGDSIESIKTVYKLTELTKGEFQQFSVTHQQANFLQTVEFAELREKRGWQKNFFVGIKDRENKVIGAALMSGMKNKLGFYYEIDGGMLLDYSDTELVTQFIHSIKKFAKRHNGLLLTIRPNIVYQKKDSNGLALDSTNQLTHDLLLSLKLKHEGFTRGYENKTPRCIFVKDLTGMTQEELLSSYNSSSRAKINRTAKNGIQVRTLTESELPIFRDIMNSTSNRKNFHVKDLDYYKALKKTFKEQAKFLVAEIDLEQYMKSLFNQLVVNEENDTNLIVDTPKKKKRKAGLKEERLAIQKRLDEIGQISRKVDITKPLILAGGLFIVSSNEVLYLFGGMYEEYQNLGSPTHLLQHHMMSYAIKHQTPRYNFYGISGIYDGSDGVLNFKKLFGGYVEEQLGSYNLVVSPVRNFVYKQLKKRIR